MLEASKVVDQFSLGDHNTGTRLPLDSGDKGNCNHYFYNSDIITTVTAAPSHSMQFKPQG